ncbi:MAG: response regulator transcription factor [Marmoricola sp.]
MGEASRPVVVVADDDADLRPLIAATLQKAGFAVEAVGGGTEALAAIRRLRPDLAVVDATMPGLSGQQVIERVRSDESLRGCRFILVTGHRSRDGDADDYLDKPFSPRELAARAEALLG